jgi:hypothetical protein
VLERYAVAIVRYSIFPSDFGTLCDNFLTRSDIEIRSVADRCNKHRQVWPGLLTVSTHFSAACGTSSLPRAVPEPTALLLLLDHLTDHTTTLPPATAILTLLYYHTTQTYPRPLLTISPAPHSPGGLVTSSTRSALINLKPQPYTSPTRTSPTRRQPIRNTSTAAVP